KCNRYFADNIVALAGKYFMRFNTYHYKQIPIRTTMAASFSLTTNTHYLPVINTCWNLHCNFASFTHPAAAVTDCTRFLVDLTVTTAARAGTTGLDRTEWCPLDAANLTSTAAVGTGFQRRARLGLIAVAVGADFGAGDFNSFF